MPLHVSRSSHKRATSQDPSASRPVKRTKRKHAHTNQTTVAGDLHVEGTSDSDDEMPALAPLCTMCNSAGTVTCTRCHSSKYCSKRCQEGDWLSHKLLCKSFSKLRKSAPGTVRAILFPTDTLKPQWVELPPWELGKSKVHEMVAERLQMDKVELAHSAIRRNDVLDRDTKSNDMGLRRTIRISRPFSCADKLGEGAVNRSVVSATCGLSPTSWRGPIIAYGTWQTELWESVSSFDLDMEDYRCILDWFLYRQAYLEPPRLRFSSTWSHTSHRVEGVRINCIGDQVFRGLPPFESVSLPRRHEMFDIHNSIQSSASHLSESVGMPVYAWKLRMDPEINSTGPMKNYFSNASASALFFGSLTDTKDATSRDWSRPSRAFEGEIGSVVIARSNGRPLSVYHAEMLCAFARYHMRALSLAEDQLPAQRDAEGIWDHVLKSYISVDFARQPTAGENGFFDQLNNSALIEFFDWYREKKLEDDEYSAFSPWIDVSLPGRPEYRLQHLQ